MMTEAKLTQTQKWLLEDMENHGVTINRYNWYDKRECRMRSSFRTRCDDARWDGESVHPGTVRALLDAGLIAYQDKSSMPFYYLAKYA
jgi:hypothetical protein